MKPLLKPLPELKRKRKKDLHRHSRNSLRKKQMARRLISHSEVDSFVQCERKHAYAHIQKLQPKARSEGISRGNAGHKVLEVWAKGLIAGDEDALEKGLAAAASMPNAVQGMALATEWI